MQTLFGILFFVSLLSLVVGLIRPRIFNRVFKGEAKRKTVGLVFGIATVLFFFLIGVSDPKLGEKIAANSARGQEASSEAVEFQEGTTVENTSESSTKDSSEQTVEGETELHSVVQVVDGDTIKIDINGKVETLRLIGMDTPETVDPRKPVQCFGKEASDKAKEILTGKKVRIEADSTQGELDKYNRLLRYVFLEDGTFYNKLMIAEGYANEYTYQSNPYKYQAEFKEAAKQAREQKKGLWSADTCNGDATKAANESASVVPKTTPSSTTPAPEVTTTSPSQATDSPQVKKSTSAICHERGSTYYERTKNFVPYNSIQECLNSGGRLPKN